jgi:nucleotide-binding universal stress UspA family protein
MRCYRTILVALGGSPDADAALQHAARLAHDQHARLVVMAIVPPAIWVNGIGTGAMFAVDLEPSVTHELHEAVKALPADLGVTTRLARGHAVQCIREVADECDCDLIVMGFQRLGRMQRALKGSVSDAVARKCSRPVLVVRSRSIPQARARFASEAKGLALPRANHLSRAFCRSVGLSVRSGEESA